MRAVAFCTFTVDNRGVFAFDIFYFPAGIRTVACEAQKSLIGDDHPGDIASVHFVTFKALAFPKGLMGGAFYSPSH
jgi:hypothetical protein